MNINQITIITMAVMLTAFTPGIAADPGNKGNADKNSHEQSKGKPDKHQDADSHKQSWVSNDNHDEDDRDRSEHRDKNSWWGDNDGWRSADYHGNENSNRQSDPDSTRGLERAAERHAMNEDKHDPIDHDRTNRESRWYDFIFGKDRVKADQDRIDDKHDPIDHDRTNRESRWYDFIFGKDRVKADQDRIDDLAEKKPRWWWPFN